MRLHRSLAPLMPVLTTALIAAATALTAGTAGGATPSPAAAEKIILSLSLRGENASRNLADAYDVLYTKFRAIVGRPNGTPLDLNCIDVSEFFDFAVCNHVWPKEAWRVQAFRWTVTGSHRNERVDSRRLSLPYTTADTYLTIVSIEEASALGVDAKRRAAICKTHGWDRLSDGLKSKIPDESGENRAQQDCIIKVEPESKLSNLINIPAQVRLVQPAYTLKIERPINRDLAVKIMKAIVSTVAKRDPSSSGTIAGHYDIPSKQNADPLPTTQTVDPCTQANSESLRKAIHWRKGRKANFATYLYVIDPAILEAGDLKDPHYTSDTFAEADDQSETLSFSCADLETTLSASELHKAHPLSVASIAYGRTVQMKLVDGTFFPFDALMPPQDGEYSPIKLLTSNSGVGSAGRAAVAVASYEEAWDPSPTEWTTVFKSARAFANSSTAAIVLAAADHRTGTGPFPPYKQLEDPSGKFPSKSECNVLPTCLGVTPLGMTVAPLDQAGNLLPDYRLGSSVVSVSAPGSNLLAALPSSPGKLRLGLVSGSSFAAPAVAALAIAIDQTVDEDRPYRVLERIAATADLYESDQTDASYGTKMTDLVRFGEINAERALEGIEKSYAAIWRYAAISPTEPVYARIEAPIAIKPGDFTCPSRQERRKLEDDLHRGCVRLFYPHVNYTSGPDRKNPLTIGVNSLLRIVPERKTDNQIPMFTVIYSYPLSERFPGFETARILRDVLFRPDQGPAPCNIDDSQSLGVPACLYRKLEKGDGDQFEPLDLRTSDIVFPMRNASLPREAKEKAWTSFIDNVWKSAAREPL